MSKAWEELGGLPSEPGMPDPRFMEMAIRANKEIEGLTAKLKAALDQIDLDTNVVCNMQEQIDKLASENSRLRAETQRLREALDIADAFIDVLNLCQDLYYKADHSDEGRKYKANLIARAALEVEK